MPKFIYLLHSSPEAESGAAPPTEIIQAMMVYNKSLSDANMLLAGEGFQASSKGARISFSKEPITPSPSSGGKVEGVQKGPFDVNGLICGFWVVQAKDMDEAVEWAKKAPLRDTTLEVRRIFGAEDFGDNMTEEMRKEEGELWAKAQERAN